MESYDDIIRLPHHVSQNHPQMPLRDRAAQFAPFAALTGYEAAVGETARLTAERRELDAQEAAETAELEKEKRLQLALLDIKKKLGKNAVLKVMNLMEGATAKARNEQIGGHKK